MQKARLARQPGGRTTPRAARIVCLPAPRPGRPCSASARSGSAIKTEVVMTADRPCSASARSGSAIKTEVVMTADRPCSVSARSGSAIKAEVVMTADRRCSASARSGSAIKTEVVMAADRPCSVSARSGSATARRNRRSWRRLSGEQRCFFRCATAWASHAIGQWKNNPHAHLGFLCSGSALFLFFKRERTKSKIPAMSI